MGKETVLLYGLEKKKEEAVKKLCLQLGIKAKHISPEQFHLPVGVLSVIRNAGTAKPASRMPLANPAPSEIPEEMMIMDGFSPERMDRFLERMKKMGISGIALKAVVTEFNKNWDSVQLYRELKAEHEKFILKEE